MTELTLFGDAVPIPDQPTPDTVGDALIQHGLVPNTFILDLNKGLTVPHDMELPYPWSLPSRLFRFPIEVTDQDEDGARRIGVLHPLLKDHPFVRHVEATMGVAVDPEGVPNKYGYSKANTGQWWHAVDLVSSGHWRELLDTARFTTPEHIAGAVSYGLDYSPHQGKRRNGYISTQEAREIMAAIEAPAPQDRDATIRDSFRSPSACTSEKGSVSWPTNMSGRADNFADAWGHILGIEAGYFAHDRAGFLAWTARGRESFPTAERVVAPKPIESPTPPKQAKVEPDEIAVRPTPTTTAQLALF